MNDKLKAMFARLDRQDAFFAANYPKEAEAVLGKDSRNVLRWISAAELKLAKGRNAEALKRIRRANSAEHRWLMAYLKCMRIIVRSRKFRFLEPLADWLHRKASVARRRHMEFLTEDLPDPEAEIRRLDACMSCYYRALARKALME